MIMMAGEQCSDGARASQRGMKKRGAPDAEHEAASCLWAFSSFSRSVSLLPRTWY